MDPGSAFVRSLPRTWRRVRAAKTERDTTCWKEALNSERQEALEDHQGSLCPFIAAFLSGTLLFLLLLPLILFLLLSPYSFSHSVWSAGAIWSRLIVLMRTQSSSYNVPATPNSHSTLAGSTYCDELCTLQGHAEIFQTDALPVPGLFLLWGTWTYMGFQSCLCLRKCSREASH